MVVLLTGPSMSKLINKETRLSSIESQPKKVVVVVVVVIVVVVDPKT